MRIANPFFAARISARQNRISSPPLQWDLPAPFTIGSDDGIPCRMDRTHALGNAVVPQIPEIIGRAIIAHEGG
jgi:hypothetical protein